MKDAFKSRSKSRTFNLFDRIIPALLFATSTAVFCFFADKFGLWDEVLIASEIRVLGLFSIIVTTLITIFLAPNYLSQIRKGDSLWFGARPGIAITYLSSIIIAVTSALWVSLTAPESASLSFLSRFSETIPLAILFSLIGTVITSCFALPIGILAGHLLWRYGLATSTQHH